MGSLQTSGISAFFGLSSAPRAESHSDSASHSGGSAFGSEEGSDDRSDSHQSAHDEEGQAVDEEHGTSMREREESGWFGRAANRQDSDSSSGWFGANWFA